MKRHTEADASEEGGHGESSAAILNKTVTRRRQMVMTIGSVILLQNPLGGQGRQAVRPVREPRTATALVSKVDGFGASRTRSIPSNTYT